jgi:hypothetical protein
VDVGGGAGRLPGIGALVFDGRTVPDRALLGLLRATGREAGCRPSGGTVSNAASRSPLVGPRDSSTLGIDLALPGLWLVLDRAGCAGSSTGGCNGVVRYPAGSPRREFWVFTLS